MIDNTVYITPQTIHEKLAELHAQMKIHPEIGPRIYDNKALMTLLGIKDRYLKRLRDNGLLVYTWALSLIASVSKDWVNC